MKKIITLLFLLIAFAFAEATTLKIGILTHLRIKSLIALPSTGSYEVFGDDVHLVHLNEKAFIQFAMEGNRILVKNFSQDFGTFSVVRIIAEDPSYSFKIKSSEPKSDVYTFDDNLEVRIFNGALQTVNMVNIEDYIAGVVEGETGKNSNPEFLKVQVTICRTYALSHLTRHKQEGYNLCDKVHCQVYKGKQRFNHAIRAGVESTRGLVIVDKNLNMITAAFHSNCGGQTHNSEEVWSSALPYLRTREDTFCLNQPNSRWQKQIPIDDWKNYLSHIDDNPFAEGGNNYDLVSSERQRYYNYKGVNIPLKSVRVDWGLKSTYFSIIEMQDTLVLSGKGFGHGVGLCQEGAMHMAELGYNCEEIIRFYYKDVSLIQKKILKNLLD